MQSLHLQSFARDSVAMASLVRMTRHELEDLQLVKLKRLVKRLWASNGFYRNKWMDSGVDPNDIHSLNDFIKIIPVTTNSDFLEDQNINAPFGARLGLSNEANALVNLTGGTSGQGQEYYGRSQKDVMTQAFMHFVPWFMAGLRRGDIAINCVPAGGMSTGGWGPAEGIRLAGATGLHVGGVLSTEAKISLMKKLGKVHFIYASTNYIHTLTQAILQSGVIPAKAFPMMKAVFIAAEGYPVEWAQELKANWGCPVHEGYGSTQGAGFIASTCDHGVVRSDGQRGRMHLFEWAHIAEVIDPDTGLHVNPGEEGELILTNLDIQASPVVRFSTKDRVRWNPYNFCNCGLPWNTLEAGSIGRYDDMIKIRGNNIWPVTIDQIIFKHTEISEYTGRVSVDGANKTNVEICIAFKINACDDDKAASLIELIRKEIKDQTNIWIDFKVVLASELPEYTYKARRWRDERKEGYREGAST